MKNNRIPLYFIGTLAAALAAGISIHHITHADTAPVPGSADDPFVTKSYVDAKIQALASSGSTGTNSTGSSTSASSGYQVVLVPQGKTVEASTPAGLEVIVRTGTAAAVTLDPSNGIADMTSGTNQSDGNVGLNHYLILARNDGRGLKVTSDGGSYMLIRGSYVLK